MSPERMSRRDKAAIRRWARVEAAHQGTALRRHWAAHAVRMARYAGTIHLHDTTKGTTAESAIKQGRALIAGDRRRPIYPKP